MSYVGDDRLLSAACPDDRCDGSGFLFDEETPHARSRARAGPRGCARKRAARRRRAAAEGASARSSFDREPVASIAAPTRTCCARCARYVRRRSPSSSTQGRGIWFTGDVGTGKTTLAMLISKAAMEADRTVAIYSLPRLLALLRETFDDDAAVLAQRADRPPVRGRPAAHRRRRRRAELARGCSSSSTRSSTRATRTARRSLLTTNLSASDGADHPADAAAAPDRRAHGRRGSTRCAAIRCRCSATTTAWQPTSSRRAEGPRRTLDAFDDLAGRSAAHGPVRPRPVD